MCHRKFWKQTQITLEKLQICGLWELFYTPCWLEGELIWIDDFKGFVRWVCVVLRHKAVELMTWKGFLSSPSIPKLLKRKKWSKKQILTFNLNKMSELMPHFATQSSPEWNHPLQNSFFNSLSDILSMTRSTFHYLRKFRAECLPYLIVLRQKPDVWSDHCYANPPKRELPATISCIIHGLSRTTKFEKCPQANLIKRTWTISAFPSGQVIVKRLVSIYCPVKTGPISLMRFKLNHGTSVNMRVHWLIFFFWTIYYEFSCFLKIFVWIKTTNCCCAHYFKTNLMW